MREKNGLRHLTAARRKVAFEPGLVIRLRQHSAADLAPADKEELERTKAGEVGVGQNPIHVFGIEGFELMQTD